ncbi:hypothetical protein THII_1387 [Thioploca ingrica]|uniref:Uncharacterized protein n=1 Tax=Thioploca ingrica TaxID=40754 RepID=A0A090AF71_9GAMM|nr:hypothetical protein THII_1387 [Thioploca ingrica]
MNTLDAPISNFVVNHDYPNAISANHYQKLVDELEYTRLMQQMWVLLYRIFHLAFFKQLAKKAQRRMTKIQPLLTKHPQQLLVFPNNYTPLISYLALDAMNSLEEQE